MSQELQAGDRVVVTIPHPDQGRTGAVVAVSDDGVKVALDAGAGEAEPPVVNLDWTEVRAEP